VELFRNKIIRRLTGVLFLMMFAGNIYAEQHPFGIGDADYNNLIQSSIVSAGNNYRLKKVLEKIEKGEKVWIAAIGGSVTEGAGPEKFTDGYAYQFFRELQKHAPGEGKNLYFNNAGLSGTSSLLGRLRYDSDVIQICGQTPDLLIVEFAVNDGGEVLFQRSFEALVHDALVANPETAVIALYSAATYGNTMAMKKPVSEYYRIPHVNMLELVNNCIKKNIFTKEQYYTDIVHPTFEGHELMKDCLMKLLENAEKAELDEAFEIPAVPLKNKNLIGLQRVTEDCKDVNILSKGCFSSTDSKTQALKKNNKGDFPQNWYKKASAISNEAFKMEIDCKALVFAFKNQASWESEKYGKAEVYVDGRLAGTFDGGKESGWNNSEVTLLFDGVSSKKRIIEIKMASGSEALGFTILGFAYTK